ncbi:response regulator [Persicirhabdus sediminis]|uniref:Response regulator n=1 Tax=Persicirhabdus sediminis TaxID=454144 RepID=A0A8J7MB10_9BACT|nr:response regulator [Persicirhabdus sediminis]MBK1789807.1 response regulator [Persicirhabdus sediminis]
MKLLIVDDSAMIRRAIASAYQGTTFTDIQTASDGLLAVTIFKTFLPDVVTLDITMPHMDGLAALTQMLEIKPNTNVLVISALADHHTAIESLSRGANQFICKPFTPEDLKEALDDLTLGSPNKLNNSTSRQEEQSIKLQTSAILEKKMPTPPEGLTDSATPKADDYPSGYVTPPNVKPQVSLTEHEKSVKP